MCNYTHSWVCIRKRRKMRIYTFLTTTEGEDKMATKKAFIRKEKNELRRSYSVVEECRMGRSTLQRKSSYF